jgi:hypothetical protein
MDLDAELLALYRAAPDDCKATILLALSGLTESAFTAVLNNAPAERKEIVLLVARKFSGLAKV